LIHRTIDPIAPSVEFLNNEPLVPISLFVVFGSFILIVPPPPLTNARKI